MIAGKNLKHIWHVRASQNRKNKEDKYEWLQNVSEAVEAVSISEAISIFLEHYPLCTIWGVQHGGKLLIREKNDSGSN